MKKVVVPLLLAAVTLSVVFFLYVEHRKADFVEPNIKSVGHVLAIWREVDNNGVAVTFRGNYSEVNGYNDLILSFNDLEYLGKIQFEVIFSPNTETPPVCTVLNTKLEASICIASVTPNWVELVVKYKDHGEDYQFLIQTVK